MKNKIYIFDTTLRDGEQVPRCRIDTKDKLFISEHLEKLGVDVIEAGFPASSPGDYKSVLEVSKLIKKASICALSRAVESDINVAGEALKYAVNPRIHTGIGTSDQHVFTKIRTTRENILEISKRAVRHAKKLVENVEFYAEDAGRTENSYLAKVIETVIAAGATIINIPDTTGYCLPWDYGKKIKYLKENVKNIDKVIISTHCHNDLGMATANSIAGIRNGARQIECTINGIGERAGNTALEEVVMIIKQHTSLPYRTSIETKRLSGISDLVSQTMNMPVQPNKAVVGSNAFAHSAGIHQDGVLKERSNYEIIDPNEVGVDDSSIVLTARSGRAALNYRLKKIDISLAKDELNSIYQKFLKLADRKSVIDDKDLQKLVGK